MFGRAWTAKVSNIRKHATQNVQKTMSGNDRCKTNVLSSLWKDAWELQKQRHQADLFQIRGTTSREGSSTWQFDYEHWIWSCCSRELHDRLFVLYYSQARFYVRTGGNLSLAAPNVLVTAAVCSITCKQLYRGRFWRVGVVHVVVLSCVLRGDD